MNTQVVINPKYVGHYQRLTEKLVILKNNPSVLELSTIKKSIKSTSFNLHLSFIDINSELTNVEKYQADNVQEVIYKLSELIIFLQEEMEVRKDFYINNNQQNSVPQIIEPITSKKGNEKIMTKINNGIFIVHGHDRTMVLEVERLVEHIGLDPVILGDQVDQGFYSIFDKFERHANESKYAIILFSPDDETTEGKRRARQNVIFELGYFLGKFGKDKVTLLNKDSTEQFDIPTDVIGSAYIKFDNEGAWKIKLARALNASGLSVDYSKIK